MSNRVIPAGSINPNSTIAPGIVVLESLTPGVVSGAATNLVGVVGTATSGPVNSPVLVSDPDSYADLFGSVQTTKYDMGTFVNAAFLQGTSVGFYCVRVTDGTDTDANTRLLDTQTLPATGAILTTLYTGTTGNTLQATLTAGSLTGTYTLTIGRPGYVAERFQNIAGSGATFWANLVSAVNNGISGQRGPSQLCVASAGDGVNTVNITSGGTGYTTATVSATGGGGTGFAATAIVSSGAVNSITITNRGTGYSSAPTITISGDGSGAAATATIGSTGTPAVTVNAYTFSGGTNGNTGVNGTTELGVNSANRTGMYALTNTNVNLLALVDCDDSTTYSDQLTFAQQNACQAILVGPAGQTVTTAITAKSNSDIADDSAVYLMGDWCYWKDTNNGGIVRMISPQGFYCGLMANLSPEQSPLNKPLNGILNTQKTSQNQIYSDNEAVLLMENGIEVLTNPAPRGPVFAPFTGKSAGLDLTTNNVYIQRMANYLGLSLSKSGVLGAFIGQLQTPSVRASARNAIVAFLQNQKIRNQIEDFTVQLDDSNNPNSRVILGFMEAEVNVQLFGVIIVFLIDLNVGTVTIQST